MLYKNVLKIAKNDKYVLSICNCLPINFIDRAIQKAFLRLLDKPTQRTQSVLT